MRRGRHPLGRQSRVETGPRGVPPGRARHGCCLTRLVFGSHFDAKMAATVVTAGAEARAGAGGKTAGATAGPKTGVQAKTAGRSGMAVFVHLEGGSMAAMAIGGRKFSFEVQ